MERLSSVARTCGQGPVGTLSTCQLHFCTSTRTIVLQCISSASGLGVNPVKMSFEKLPALHGAWTTPGPKPCGVINTGAATCYVSSLLQALAHVPIISNLPVKTWKQACGCPAESHCWSCYIGVWINSRSAAENASDTPQWILQRLHLIYKKARKLGRRKDDALDKVWPRAFPVLCNTGPFRRGSSSCRQALTSCVFTAANDHQVLWPG